MKFLTNIILRISNIFSCKPTLKSPFSRHANRQNQASGDNSINLQAGRDINLALDTSALSEITEQAIKKAFSQALDQNNSQTEKILHLIENGEVSEAEVLIDAMRKDAKIEYTNKTRTVGNLYTKVNRDKAIDCYKISTSLEHDDYDTMNTLSLLLLEKGETKEALTIFSYILENSRDNLINEKIHGNLGILYKNNGKFLEALFHLNQANELAILNRNSLGSCRHLNNIGSCYNNQEDTINAEKHLTEALNLTRNIINQSTITPEKQTAKSIQSNILTNLSITEQKKFNETGNMDHLEKAENYLGRAIEIDETLNNPNSLGRHYGNLANVLLKKGDIPGSRIQLEKSISYFKNNHSLKDELTSLANLGRAFATEGNHNEAMHHYKQSLKRNPETLFPKLRATTLKLMAEAHRELGESSQSLDCTTEADSIVKSLNSNTKHTK